MAMANDGRTWGTRQQAEERAPLLPKPYGAGGVGIEFAPLDDARHLSGIDLDSCRDPATGAIEPWAQAWIDRLASYTEISPSKTGVKIFFVHVIVDRDRLQFAIGLGPKGQKKHSVLWTRGRDGDHPPAVELHLSNRYFAVTDDILPGCTDELREVPTDDLLQIIAVDGPAFVTETGNAEIPVSSKSNSTRKRGTIGNTDLSRSAQAFRVGAKARRDGASFDEMSEAIRTNPDTADWYTEKGTASAGRELQRIWEKADPLEGDLILSPSAPLVSARQFIGRLHTAEGVRTLHHQNASFYTWERSHYIEHAPEETRATLYRFLDTAMTYDDEELVAFNPTRAKVANVQEALAAEAQLSRAIRPAWLASDDTNPGDVISCRNGLLHLPSKKTRDHTPTFFTLNALNFDYQPKAPAPVAWIGFLASVWPNDPDAIGTLQEFFGLCLAADTSHQKAFLVVGPKRSGKGTIARVLTELLGAANVCSPTLGSLSTNFGLAPMISKRLAIISDARLSGKADQAVIAERLLAITGEDGLTIDRKFREAWTGKLDARFLILTNELPRLTDSSGALAGRFIILTMTRSFFGNEDRGMLGKLLPELPGILNWAIDGWERLNKRGHFVPPRSSAAAAREMEDLGSPIGAFLRDCCIVEQGLGVRAAELYGVWCEWCRQHGRDHPGTTQTFGRDLRAAVPGLTDVQPRGAAGKRERYYKGVGLNPELVLARDGTRANALCSALPKHSETYPNGVDPYG